LSKETIIELHEFKTLKSLIDQSFAITEVKNEERSETRDLNCLKNEILQIKACLRPNLSLECLPKNAFELFYYYKIGILLCFVMEKIKSDHSDVSELHPNSIVTGLIKGTGIANLFLVNNSENSENNKIKYDSKKARNFYIKSKRIYLVYKNFPNPLAQIISSDSKVTANRFLKIKNELIFENFLKEIKCAVDSNYDKFVYQSGTPKFDERVFIEDTLKGFTDNIISEVLEYVKNPSISIKEQVTANPLLQK
jgi:hypothetical protein